MPFAEQPIPRTDPEHLTIEVGPESGACLVSLVGELDMDTASAVERELKRLLASELETVVVDLGGLTFIDSTGVVCLVKAARLSAENGDRLRILPGDERTMEVVRVGGVDKVLPLIG